jgi:hypothetical protein
MTYRTAGLRAMAAASDRYAVRLLFQNATVLIADYLRDWMII